MLVKTIMDFIKAVLFGFSLAISIGPIINPDYEPEYPLWS